MFSESLKGVVKENFSGGFAPIPPRVSYTGQKTGLDPLLILTSHIKRTLLSFANSSISSDLHFGSVALLKINWQNAPVENNIFHPVRIRSRERNVERRNVYVFSKIFENLFQNFREYEIREGLFPKKFLRRTIHQILVPRNFLGKKIHEFSFIQIIFF